MSKNYLIMENFESIINGNQLTLVDFFATWCGPCKSQSAILPELKNEVGEMVKILKIDVDKNSNLASLYGVRSVPTLIIFKGGNVLWRESGVHDVVTLKNIIENLK